MRQKDSQENRIENEESKSSTIYKIGKIILYDHGATSTYASNGDIDGIIEEFNSRRQRQISKQVQSLSDIEQQTNQKSVSSVGGSAIQKVSQHQVRSFIPTSGSLNEYFYPRSDSDDDDEVEDEESEQDIDEYDKDVGTFNMYKTLNQSCQFSEDLEELGPQELYIFIYGNVVQIFLN